MNETIQYDDGFYIQRRNKFFFEVGHLQLDHPKFESTIAIKFTYDDALKALEELRRDEKYIRVVKDYLGEA